MAYKSIDAKVKQPTNREQRRKLMRGLMRGLGLLKGATKKRTASLKVVRNG